MTGRSPKSHSLIVGGGIGGLATAVALGRNGHALTLLERSSFEDEMGAGIQLGPNATRALRELGVIEAIEALSFKPEAIWIFDALSGRRLATMPLRNEVEHRYGAPYLTLRRADLHACLLQASQGLDSVELRQDFDVVTIWHEHGKVVAAGADCDEAEGSMLVGADGLWSTVRGLVAPEAKPHFAEATAWRTLLPRARLPSPFDAPVVGLWLGPRAHLVHYPVRGGKDLNLVAVVEGGEAKPGWSETGDVSAFRANFARWAKDSQSLLESVEDWRGWSLYRLQPLRRWSSGNIALIGDAAHPTLPYMAQGAALAIEDAVTLADCLEAYPGDPPPAFHRYETLRRARAARVQRFSRQLGGIYHWSGPLRLARNLALAAQRDRGLRRFDWVYRG
jgi:3-hydroxybenzoate 6-monooxygenase